MSTVKYCSDVPYLPSCSQTVYPANCLTNFGCQPDCYPKPVLPVTQPSLEWLGATQYQQCCPSTNRECESTGRELPVPLNCNPRPIVCQCPPDPNPCATDCDDDQDWIELCQGTPVKSQLDVSGSLAPKQPFKPAVKTGGCTSCGGNTY